VEASGLAGSDLHHDFRHPVGQLRLGAGLTAAQWSFAYGGGLLAGIDHPLAELQQLLVGRPIGQGPWRFQPQAIGSYSSRWGELALLPELSLGSFAASAGPLLRAGAEVRRPGGMLRSAWALSLGGLDLDLVVQGRLWRCPVGTPSMLGQADLDLGRGFGTHHSFWAGVGWMGTPNELDGQVWWLDGVPPAGQHLLSTAAGLRLGRSVSWAVLIEGSSSLALGTAPWSLHRVGVGLQGRIGSPGSGLQGLHPRPVVLRIEAPGAQRVEVAGTFSGWRPLQLRPNPDGSWELELELDGGIYEYSFFIDGRAVEPPPEVPRVEDGFGGHNRILVVEG
jgi:hypothetical protein